MLQALQKGSWFGLLLLCSLPCTAQVVGGADTLSGAISPLLGTASLGNPGALSDALSAGGGDMLMPASERSLLGLEGVSAEPLPGLDAPGEEILLPGSPGDTEPPLAGIGDGNPAYDTITPISPLQAEQLSSIMGLCSDVDGDSVCDVEDYCPDTPPGAVVLPNGCHLSPDIPLELVGIFFDFNEARFRPESQLILERVVALLQQKADVTVEVSGHTDARGSSEFNLRLSERRAESVYEYLVEHGIAPYRLSYRGYGDSQPVAPNRLAPRKDNPDGRAMNRRVELRVTGSLAELDR